MITILCTYSHLLLGQTQVKQVGCYIYYVSKAVGCGSNISRNFMLPKLIYLKSMIFALLHTQ